MGIQSSRSIFCAVVGAAVFMSANMAGCGGGDGADASTQSKPIKKPVDPRYATLDAYVAHINRILTREKVDYNTFLDLMFAENDRQTAPCPSSSGGFVMMGRGDSIEGRKGPQERVLGWVYPQSGVRKPWAASCS